MERLTRTPLGVFLAFCVAFYATGLGYVYNAQGLTVEAFGAVLLAIAATLLMLRAADRPA